MIKHLFLAIISLTLLISIQTVYADETNSLDILTNKAITLALDKQYEKALDRFNEILDLEPNNPVALEWIPKILNEIPAKSTINSEYVVHIQMTLRDEDGKLVSVLESTNARYVPTKFLEIWWNTLIDRGTIVNENGIEKLQITTSKNADLDHIASFLWEAEIAGKAVQIFEVYVPMMQYNDHEKVELQWTIIKR
jgi:tetratricopeptide (TPR) repeat protein